MLRVIMLTLIMLSVVRVSVVMLSVVASCKEHHSGILKLLARLEPRM